MPGPMSAPNGLASTTFPRKQGERITTGKTEKKHEKRHQRDEYASKTKQLKLTRTRRQEQEQS